MLLSRSAFFAAAIALGLAAPAVAHHSGAAYDMGNQQTMEGTVKTVNWTNPHITFVIEKDAKEVRRIEGLTDAASLEAMIKPLVEKA